MSNWLLSIFSGSEERPDKTAYYDIVEKMAEQDNIDKAYELTKNCLLSISEEGGHVIAHNIRRLILDEIDISDALMKKFDKESIQKLRSNIENIILE